MHYAIFIMVMVHDHSDKNIVQPLMQSQFQKIKNIKLKLLQKYKRDSIA